MSLSDISLAVVGQNAHLQRQVPGQTLLVDPPTLEWNVMKLCGVKQDAAFLQGDLGTIEADAGVSRNLYSLLIGALEANPQY